MIAFVVWDAEPGLLTEEQDARLIVAHDEREARAIYIRVCTVGDEGAPQARPAVWQWDTPTPSLPDEPGEWKPEHWRGFGLHEIGDKTCMECGEYTDPSDLDHTGLCLDCLGD